MRKIIRLSAPVLILLLATTAAGEKPAVWIASGASGGTYRGIYAANFERELRGYDVLHRKSTGSGENLDLLSQGRADIAFVQADVYAEWLQKDPERTGSLQVLGRIGEECVFIAYRADGPLTSLSQLGQPVGDRPARIAVGPEGGGMSGTWAFMATLDPALASATVEGTGDTLALNRLAVGAYDAVGWVTDPMNLDHKMLTAVRSNSALELMDIQQPALVASLADGTQIYRQRKVELEEGWRPDAIETICTSALVIARKGVDPKLVVKLSDIIASYPAP